MLTQEDLERSPLFENISYQEYCRMLTCFQAVQRTFRPDELVYDFGSPKNDAVGIMERGEAALIRIDEDGVSTVMEELGPGGVFGRTLAFSGTARDSLEVICRTPCDVLFIDYAHILKRCENACTHHSLLVQNMLKLMSDKAQGLSRRVDPGKAAVLFPPACRAGGGGELHTAIFSQHAGGLYCHGPQRHDAGVKTPAHRGSDPVGRPQNHPVSIVVQIV